MCGAKLHTKILVVMVDKCDAIAAYTARAQVAMGVWFRHRNWLTCRPVPLAKRLHHMYA